VKDEYSRILRKRKRKIARRLERKQWSEQRQPMFSARTICYEMAERISAIPCGGIGAFHLPALIPAGKFTMGNDTPTFSLGSMRPAHEVTISKPFHMGIYEVTQEQYEQITSKSRVKKGRSFYAGGCGAAESRGPTV